MGLIQNHIASGIFDRIAHQANAIKSTFNTETSAGTPLYQKIHSNVNPFGDFDVEDALISAAHGVDANTLSGTFFKNVYSTILSDIDSHVSAKGAVSTDSWLNISGLNLHPDLDDVYFSCKGSHLNARNVFHADANVLVATYAATGSGTGVYASVTPIGTGTGKVTPTNHAAAKMVLIPVGNVTADAQFNLRLLQEQPTDGSQASNYNVVVPNSTLSGTQFPIQIAPGNIASGYLDVTNIVVAGSTSGNAFRVYAIREREIAL